MPGGLQGGMLKLWFDWYSTIIILITWEVKTEIENSILRNFREIEKKPTSIPLSPPPPQKKNSFKHSSLAPPLENLLRGPCQWRLSVKNPIETGSLANTMIRKSTAGFM